eukprot:TRINITY_DN2442_c0_g1_i3.p2 TRINITY_DN2442_c0_g1~~TRINITY_DN2442_c0_g1_i3.p2  ORF type:complete len:158 (+),score=21.64 TRINITY_DN2442_c0_g1_i3:301-774(+)
MKLYKDMQTCVEHGNDTNVFQENLELTKGISHGEFDLDNNNDNVGQILVAWGQNIGLDHEQTSYQDDQVGNSGVFAAEFSPDYKKFDEQWPDFGCEGIKVQRAHQPTSQCQECNRQKCSNQSSNNKMMKKIVRKYKFKTVKMWRNRWNLNLMKQMQI